MQNYLNSQGFNNVQVRSSRRLSAALARYRYGLDVAFVNKE